MSRYSAGFTLLETVIALAVLAVSFTAISMALSSGTQTLAGSRAQARAVEVLRTQFEVIKATQQPLASIKSDKAMGGDITWRVTARTVPNDGVSSVGFLLQDVTIEVVWKEGSQDRRMDIETRHFGVGAAPP